MSRRLLLCGLIALISLPSAFAIPPPQLLLPILQSIAQFLGILLASTITYIVHIWHFIVQTIRQITRTKKWIIGGVMTTSLLITGSLVFYAYQEQTTWEESLTKNRLSTLATLQAYENVTNSSLMQRYVEANFKENESAAAKQYFTEENTLSAEAFMELIEHKDPIIIDIRDEAGWEAGRIPGSTHSRLADFIREDWKSILPIDTSRPIVLVCYGGTTGALATEFLKEKGYQESYYFKGGVMNAYEHDIPFKGTPYFVESLPEEVKTMNTERAIHQLNETQSIKGIDVRPQVPKQKRVMNSTPFFRELKTSEEVENFISELDPKITYYSICDSPITCYSARVMNYQLHRYGLKTIGIFDISEVPTTSPLIT